MLTVRLSLLAAIATLAALALAPGSAHADVNANMTVRFPFDATVGDTGLPAFVRMGNVNSAPDDGTTNTVCNFGDAIPPCEPGEQGIRVTPSCGESNGDGTCHENVADPGVFKLPATATGRTATSCAGVIFDIVSTGDSVGSVRLVPQGGAHVTIPAGSECAIDFTVDVVKFPTRDEFEFQPGQQTVQTGAHTQVLGTSLTAGAPHQHKPATGNGTTISKASSASVATTASGDVALGAGTLTDSATVSGLASPQSSGTVEFRLYGPDDGTCAGAPVFTSTKSVSPSGTTATATSDAFTPTQTGTYRWVASYSGDANNNGKAGACNDANESTNVTAAQQQQPPPGPPPPPVDDPAPVLTAFRFSPASFKASAGSRIRFTLSEAASVRVVVAQATVGRRAGGRCRATTKANRKNPKCTRFVRRRTVTIAGKAGANSAKFNARRLKRGKYRATATAVDNAAQASAPVKASFKVKR